MHVPPQRCERCNRPLEPGTDSSYCGAVCRTLASMRGVVSPPRMNDRGQATGLGNFVLAIVIGAIMTWIIQMLMTYLGPLMEAEANDPTARTAYAWSTAFLDNVAAVFLFTAVLSLLALSIYQRAIYG